MKTMKLAFGCCGGLLAVALLGGTAQAQVGTIVRGGMRVGSGGGGAAGGVTSTWHPIIYDHQVLSPAAAPRRLLIHADGTIRLVDGSANPAPLASGKLDAGALDSLRRTIAAAAGDANYLVRSGASVRVRSASGSFVPSPSGPATRDGAALRLKTMLDAMAAALARNIVVATR
ncbi:MAG TPA: hypothetical protein VFG37_02545 [Planctomycetota bacterium]|nr:hypothetical protein [Planctomycetota bacterium]